MVYFLCQFWLIINMNLLTLYLWPFSFHEYLFFVVIMTNYAVIIIDQIMFFVFICSFNELLMKARFCHWIKKRNLTFFWRLQQTRQESRLTFMDLNMCIDIFPCWNNTFWCSFYLYFCGITGNEEENDPFTCQDKKAKDFLANMSITSFHIVFSQFQVYISQFWLFFLAILTHWIVSYKVCAKLHNWRNRA